MRGRNERRENWALSSHAGRSHDMDKPRDWDDMELYWQLMERLHPDAVIKVGVYRGGSTLSFADTMCMFGLSPRVVSIGVAANVGFVDSRIRIITGDALHLGTSCTQPCWNECHGRGSLSSTARTSTRPPMRCLNSSTYTWRPATTSS